MFISTVTNHVLNCCDGTYRLCAMTMYHWLRSRLCVIVIFLRDGNVLLRRMQMVMFWHPCFGNLVIDNDISLNLVDSCQRGHRRCFFVFFLFSTIRIKIPPSSVRRPISLRDLYLTLVSGLNLAFQSSQRA